MTDAPILTPDEKIQHIRRLPLFSELAEAEIVQVEPLFIVEQYRSGEYVYRQGEGSYALYLFLTGRGRLLHVDDDGIERRGADVEPGEFVGEKSLFIYEERPNSLLIVRDAVVLLLPRRDFERFFNSHPELKARLNVREDWRGKIIVEHDFPWLRDGEIVLVYTRRHRWAFWRRTLWSIPVLMLLLPIPIVLLILPFVAAWLAILIMVPVLLLPIGLITFYHFDWRNDYFIVTNQRVVHEERILLTFNQTRDQAPLTSIQSVRTSQEGYWAERIGFGNLLIFTAGAGGTLTFDTIGDPEALAMVINAQLTSRRSNRAAEDRDKIREEIDRFIGQRALNRTRTEDVPLPGTPPDQAPPPSRGAVTRLREQWERLLRYLDIRVRIEEGPRITYRKHWIVLWKALFTPLASMIGAIILLIINLLWHYEWPWVMFHPIMRVIFFLVLFPLLGIWLWWMYEDWHNDLYIIENQTVTRIHRRPLWLQDEQSTILIRNIQGVRIEIKGIWQNMLNYGSVLVQTAADDDAGDGGLGETEFPFIYQPRALQEDILRRQRDDQVEEDQDELSQLSSEIARWLAIYHQATHPEDYSQGGDYTYGDKHRIDNFEQSAEAADDL